MSKFLAPIHFWLFNKIKIHQELEMDIERRFEKEYGEIVRDIVNKNISQYGNRLENQQLDEIIDQDNIHGWLQKNISIVETRQAAILADLFSEFGEKALELARDVFKENALKNATVAKAEMTVNSPEDVYKVVNNYILDGMPCDNAGRVTRSDDDVLESVQNTCLHIVYWKTAGVDVDIMYSLRTLWINAFVSGLNDSFEYTMDIKISNISDRTFYHKIERK